MAKMSDSENDYSEEEEYSEEESGEQEYSEQEEEESEAEEYFPEKRIKEDVVDDLFYDPYNLMAASYHKLKSWKNSKERENTIETEANRVAQLLYKKLMSLPTEHSDIGPITILPTKEEIVMPRSTKIPEPKPETRWEKFAREKGIKKTKKDRMVYDELTGEYKPRFGYKGINSGIQEIPVVEVKEGQDPYADPWAEERKEKKTRIQKNTKNQMQNLARANKKANKLNGTNARIFDPATVPGIPVEFSEGKTSKRGKDGVRKALEIVQHSTASMGRFDEMRPGEPARKLSGKKRSFRDNFSTQDDKSAMKAQIRFVADKKDKKEKGITNSLAVYEGILPDAPSLKFKKSKGRGQNAGKVTKKAKR